MAEYQPYASKGLAGAGLGTGIAGLSLSALQLLGGGNFLNGITGNVNYVTKEEFQMGQELARKDSEIALLKSEQNTEVKIADVYERLITRINADQKAQADVNASQAVFNAQTTAVATANAGSIASMQNLLGQITQTKVPNSAVCPGWGSVEVVPTGASTCGCNVY